MSRGAMKGLTVDVHDYEVSNLIRKLINFLGKNEVEKALDRYQASLKSSTLIYGQYYLKHRHPWWNALTIYFGIEKSGKSVKNNLTPELKMLAGDAKRLSVVQRTMPESVKQKFAKDLADDKRAYDYFFEIEMAWHFIMQGCEILWHETTVSHSEFLAVCGKFEFNVECKRISMDASRRVRRQDFYRLADKIIPPVRKQGYSGTIDIALTDRLHSNDGFINELANEVVDLMAAGMLRGMYEIPYGSLSLDMERTSGAVVDLPGRFRRMWERKQPNAHGAILAASKDNKPIDPIEITLMSERADRVLHGMREKLSRAAKTQLPPSRAGLICCFLEGVTDLNELASDSSLQVMTHSLFSEDELRHVAAIGYSSEPLRLLNATTERMFSRGLIFRNPQCIFEEARDFEFLAPESGQA
jgi:hypothetical protein